MLAKGSIVVITIVFLSGCVGLQIDEAIDNYQSASAKVSLGDSKEKVLSVLSPTQINLPAKAQKQPEAFLKEGKRIDIYFFRSKRQSDGLTTDDEFTPYVFTEGVLTGVGWQVLGGPRSVGQTTPETNVHIEQKKPQCTTIYSSSKGYQTVCY